jgi:nucleolar protein 4
MREASAKQRKSLIESNPTLHISLTRLSIRNIPRTVTSKDLKALAREAVVGFAKDVKAGTRDRLSKEEVARGGEEMKAAERERKLKGKGLVKQAKIVFEGLEGGKVQEGAGRSRGYGFIEYHTHRSALMGLRWLNGHSIGYTATEKKSKKESKDDVQERKKRLIVEFAIENAQVVSRRKDLEIKSRDRSKASAKIAKGEGGESHSELASNDGKGKLTAAKIRKGKSESLQTTSGRPSGTASTDSKVDKLAKRQNIIAKKRMARKARKKDST